MTDTSLDLRTVVEDLKRQRDHIRVQLHLAKADAKDEWATLEHKWEHVRGTMDRVGDEAGHAAREVGAALRLAAEELRRGYERIARLL